MTLWAIVNISSNFVREKPDYESPLLTQSLMGSVYEVKDSCGYWKKISDPGFYEGWVTDLGLAYMNDRQKDAYLEAPKYICTAKHSCIYSKPDAESEPVCDFSMGDLVRKMRNFSGNFREVILPSGVTGWVDVADVEDFRGWAETRTLDAESIVRTAKSFLGVPYMWGGNTSKYFDCSGLSHFTYRMCGVLLPRDAKDQINTGRKIPVDLRKMQAGDLVFFGRKADGGKTVKVTHVAIYIGDGKIIHSSHLVRINSLREGDPDYYRKEIVGVRRIIGHVDEGTEARSILKDPSYFKQ